MTAAEWVLRLGRPGDGQRHTDASRCGGSQGLQQTSQRSLTAESYRSTPSSRHDYKANVYTEVCHVATPSITLHHRIFRVSSLDAANGVDTNLTLAQTLHKQVLMHVTPYQLVHY